MTLACEPPDVVGRGAKRIGRVIGFNPVTYCKPNYFERALKEAHRRNRGEL